MRYVFIIIICVAAVAGAAYLLVPASPSSASTSEDKPQLYTCGMHPEIISDEPGICPICNMKLTPKRDAGNGEGSVRIDPATKQSMGLVTQQASYRTLTRTISTFGKVKVPDPNLYSITVKFDGWVERLFVSEQGERVLKGQPLLEIYSPALVAAQEELLIALKSNASSVSIERLAKSAESRLRNWDISEDQLTRLKESGEVRRTMIIRSPVDGFVKTKQVNEGDRVSARSVLYEIADLSKVWIEAYVYEQDIPYLQLGQAGRVATPGLPGRTFEGEMTYISPLLDSKGQAEVRFALNNPGFELKPEAYAEVTIEATLSDDRLAIPRSAVINSGVRQLVFVATSDDSYEPRDVVTGAVDEQDMMEIKEGLTVNDRVVVSGQFLLDSETRLNEVLDMGHAGSHGHQHAAESPREEPEEHKDHTEHKEQAEDPYDIHTCPMPSHYHVLNYGPGQCPDCGMDLVPVGETDNDKVYVCPMPQCGVATHKPGQCPVCNMNLIEYLPESSHDK